MSPGALALVLVGWAAGTILGWRYRSLDELAAPTLDLGGLSVVIPARDEARSLPRLLASLAAQTAPPLEVIVVDDGSTDGTAAVAAAAGATVVRAPDLPDGWLGKPWACHLGAERARGDRLLFLDADTWLAPDAVALLSAAHHRLAREGLLSVQPHHHVARPHEQLSLLGNIVPVLASGMFLPRRPARAEVAFGPCLLTDASVLHDVGGFAAVRADVVEDIALAAAYVSSGRVVRCLAGGRSVAFRMYPDGLRQLVDGWSKNLAGGAARAPRLLTLGAGAWVTALATVAVAAVLRPSPLVGLAWLLTSAQVAWLARRVGTFSVWTSALFPVAVAAFTGLVLRSIYLRSIRRTVRWRGRQVSVPRPGG